MELVTGDRNELAMGRNEEFGGPRTEKREARRIVGFGVKSSRGGESKSV